MGENMFMEGYGIDSRQVQRISCSTGWGSSGEWHFPIFEKVKKDKRIMIHTTDHYDYSNNPVGNVSHLNNIVFFVRANNDAHVALHTDDGGLWEIVIGGWGNGRSCIRGAP